MNLIVKNLTFAFAYSLDLRYISVVVVVNFCIMYQMYTENYWTPNQLTVHYFLGLNNASNID